MINTLRKASYRWQPREEARKRAKIGRNQYTCAECSGVFGRKDTRLDHKVSVIPLTGFDTWDGVILRMYCEVDGFQLLCLDDHSKKTKQENLIRKENRKK